FLMASRSLGELDLFGIETQPELELRVAGYARGHDGPWVVGRGWFYSAFPEGMPTVELLDRLVPDRPAYLESFDAHTGWANSRALAIAGVTTRDVVRGPSPTASWRRKRPRCCIRTPARMSAAIRSGHRTSFARPCTPPTLVDGRSRSTPSATRRSARRWMRSRARRQVAGIGSSTSSRR